MATADLGERFAQRTKTNPVGLGECRCPGTPHDRDSGRVVQQFGQDDIAAISAAGWAAGLSYGGYNVAAAELKEVELGLVSWNLVDAAGQPVPIEASTVNALDQATLAAVIEALGPAMERAQGPLPNASGALSVDGSPESASPTPPTPTPVGSTSS